MTIIRPEALDDVSSIHTVNLRAFGQPAEARLVDELRKNQKLILSLVAEKEGNVVGHIAFSLMNAVNTPSSEFVVAGLAPMAVLPEFQRQGIGSMLVRQGIEECRHLGEAGIVVLGHPEYYRRFGFRPAASIGLHCVQGVPDEAFMALEIRKGALRNLGLVQYQPEFDKLMKNNP